MPGPVAPYAETELRRRWRRALPWLVLGWFVVPTALMLPGTLLVVSDLAAGRLAPETIGVVAVLTWVPYAALVGAVLTGRLSANLAAWVWPAVLAAFVMPFGLVPVFDRWADGATGWTVAAVFVCPVLVAIPLSVAKGRLLKPLDPVLGPSPFTLERSLHGSDARGRIRAGNDRVTVEIFSDRSKDKGRTRGSLTVPFARITAIGVEDGDDRVVARRGDGREVRGPAGHQVVVLATKDGDQPLPVAEPELMAELLRRRIAFTTGRAIGSDVAGHTDVTERSEVTGHPDTADADDTRRPISDGAMLNDGLNDGLGDRLDEAAYSPLAGSIDELPRGRPVARAGRAVLAAVLLLVAVVVVPVLAVQLQRTMFTVDLGLPTEDAPWWRPTEIVGSLRIFAVWIVLAIVLLLAFRRTPRLWPRTATITATVWAVPASLLGGGIGATFGVFGITSPLGTTALGWLIPVAVITIARGLGWLASALVTGRPDRGLAEGGIGLTFRLRSAYETSGWSRDSTVDRLARRTIGRLLANREHGGAQPFVELERDRITLHHQGAESSGGTPKHAIPLSRLRLIQAGTIPGGVPPKPWPLPGGNTVELTSGPALRIASDDQQWVLPMDRPELAAGLIRARCRARARQPEDRARARRQLSAEEWRRLHRGTSNQSGSTSRRSRSGGSAGMVVGALLLTALTGATFVGPLTGDAVDFWYLGTLFFGGFAVGAWSAFVTGFRRQRIAEEQPVEPGSPPWGDPRPDHAPIPGWRLDH